LPAAFIVLSSRIRNLEPLVPFAALTDCTFGGPDEEADMCCHGVDDTRRNRSRFRGGPMLAAVGLVVSLVASGCTGGTGSTVTRTGESQTSASASGQKLIPQPAVTGLPTAPDSKRVDLALPSFSNPTNITNPLFPISNQESVLMVGRVDGEPFRTEVTLLPFTRIIQWQGLRVDTLVSQYVAFLDGRIQEVAYDHYAQADDGSVWYLGEDVFDFRDGAIVVTEGTWLAGRDGPAAMIMPGHPRVGDVYRSENAPGFVFEEVTVGSVGKQLEGPLGTIAGGMVAKELHSDGKVEQKLFAPGYGEFFTADGPDVEALALAVPTDSSSGPLPSQLQTLATDGLGIFDAAGSGKWKIASAALDRMTAAWDDYRAAGDVPRLIEPRLNEALEGLAAAVRDRKAAKAGGAAIEAARWTFDLELRYRPAAEIDLARLDLWAAQLLVDEAAGDDAGVGADGFAIDYVRDRILRALDPAELTRVNIELGAIQVAIADEEPDAAAEAARRLRKVLAELGTTN
jgi:hypothetical protein